MQQEQNSAVPKLATAPVKPLVAAQQQAKLTALDADLERERQLAAMVCSLENKEACLACGS